MIVCRRRLQLDRSATAPPPPTPQPSQQIDNAELYSPTDVSEGLPDPWHMPFSSTCLRPREQMTWVRCQRFKCPPPPNANSVLGRIVNCISGPGLRRMVIPKLVVAVCTIRYGLLCTLHLNSSYLAQKQEWLVFMTKKEGLLPVWSAYATEKLQKWPALPSPCVILLSVTTW